ncbi:glyoxalase [Flexivirga endophytica]|uniref:Glyoxalase n=1 Tax=Flexivirga endophytica TaxID=1849103 RepID=A0A916WNI3_9MICO|nr:VOC family protein [Flexivirga endophytica]GGB15353.1 glyoxalase [Flexivirga endophytica]GHB40214.1 glyoxalase [Flexivirga endophytica]
MAIARTPTLVIDCHDPGQLATFYGTLLDFAVKIDDDNSWAEIYTESWPPINFQQVADYHPPQWPGQEHPQQMHLDVEVDDLDTAEGQTLELGATKHEVQPNPSSFRVFLDPAGHPFCLCIA